MTNSFIQPLDSEIQSGLAKHYVIQQPGSLSHGEQDDERHHQAEQTHGLGQGEPQDGVGEQLLLQGWVPSITDAKGSEYSSDSCSGPGSSYSSCSGADELGCGVYVTRDGGRLESSDNLGEAWNTGHLCAESLELCYGWSVSIQLLRLPAGNSTA